ncbi:PAS domain S-box protein [Halolamina salifodinae]|uniref:histidine kinase n=1 Tax=Halolamina salifodinae TaxID=1202767 RepID=A0A8T4H0M5_9EURY|nr:PAS domain S-box protein [Halolamina salifodinae]MBP1986888.1 PAS domain S-box-containing protein [Halolamina salifodinae]
MHDPSGPIQVLHVADDPTLGDLTATYLERENDRITVETAADADEALERLDEAVDCVVADYEMPGRSGIELLEAVRVDYPDLPFILYTGKGSEEIASEAISAGVTDYLQKGGGDDQYAVLANRVVNAVEAARSQRLLARRTHRLERLIDNLPGMVYRCRNDPDWPMEAVEGEVEGLTGYDADALERGNVVWGADVIHPEDRDEVWERVQESIDDGGTFEVNYRIQSREGETRWVWERGRGVYEDGELVAIEGFITDVTERERREKRLAETTARLEALFEQSPDMINLHDAEGTISEPNARLCEKTGYSESELIGMKVWEIDRSLEPGAATQVWEQMAPGDSHRVETQYERADGSTFPVEAHIRRIDVDDETLFAVISRDITERKARERDLKRVRAEYEELIDGMNDTVWVISTDAEFLAVNDAAVERLGYDREELLGMGPHDIDVATDPEEITALIEEMPADGMQVFETVHETTDGERIPVEISSSLVSYRGETAILSVGRDISARKERERRLERFASIVSHDLRNPLNVAAGRLELAAEECESEHLDHVADAHDRMNALIDSLLGMAREGELATDPEPITLEPVAESAWSTVATGDATLQVTAAGTVMADRSRLTQLFENLFRNAVEHGSTGNQTQSGDAVEHGGPGVTITVGDLGDGFYVADDGPGVPQNERDSVFETGYTTGNGTGFGLAIVAQVADAHDWDVALTESEAGGARFEFTGVDTA